MPDITMCLKEVCPLRPTCYRATAVPSFLQSYSYFNECNNDNNFREYINDKQKNRR